MFNLHHKRYALYALAAIVLLLQSFAVWHDVEHPFHTAQAQCERFDAISHAPLADITPSIAITLQTTVVSSDTPQFAFLLPSTPRRAYSIRAPPLFS